MAPGSTLAVGRSRLPLEGVRSSRLCFDGVSWPLFDGVSRCATGLPRRRGCSPLLPCGLIWPTVLVGGRADAWRSTAGDAS